LSRRTPAAYPVPPPAPQPGPDTRPRWSPDGKRIAFASQMGRTRYYASNDRIAVVDAAGGAPRSLTDAFDEDADLVDWTPAGIFFSALQKTTGHLFPLDPEKGTVTRGSGPHGLVASGLSVTADRGRAALFAASPTPLSEAFVSATAPFAPRKLTDMSAQTAGLRLGVREVVSWKSQDGTTIEGVLVKPQPFDPGKKHPLLVVIHGGPTGVDR